MRLAVERGSRRDGSVGVSVTRPPGSPPRVAGRIIGSDGVPVVITGEPRSDGHWVIQASAPLPTVGTLELGEFRSPPFALEPDRGDAAWEALVRRLPPPPEGGKIHPSRLVLGAIAVFAALAGRNGRSRQT